MSKVIVIGIDGGDFDIIEPLIANGKLPSLAAIMSNGSYGNLSSTIPPVTAQAWVSFMTGVNPGKHGVFGFLTDTSEGYDRSIINTSCIKSKTLWKMLSEQGKRSILINVPITYPPEEIDGLIVPGMLGLPANIKTKQGASFTYPPELYSEIVDKFGQYRVGYFPGRVPFNEFRDKYIHNWKEITEIRKNTCMYLMDKYPWDFSMVVFKSPDVIQHHFWKYMDKDHPDHEPELAEKYGGIINEFYEIVDSAIGEILTRCDPSTHVIIMSDHGSGPLHKWVTINNWLIDNGYLNLKKTSSVLVRNKFPRLFYRVMRKMRHPWFRGNMPPRGVDPRECINKTNIIDWKRTKAYAGTATEQGIYLNLKGREPEGTVDPDRKYDILRDELIEKLYQLKNMSGEPVVSDVYKKEEVYNGPYINNAPDLFLKFRNEAYILDDSIYRDSIFEKVEKISGTHRMDGVFAIQGNGVANGKNISGAHITDIAPTVLHLMGLGIPDYMDGQLLKQSFNDDYLQQHPVRLVSDSSPAKGMRSREVYSDVDKEKIKEELKDLGYIS